MKNLILLSFIFFLSCGTDKNKIYTGKELSIEDSVVIKNIEDRLYSIVSKDSVDDCLQRIFISVNFNLTEDSTTRKNVIQEIIRENNINDAKTSLSFFKSVESAMYVDEYLANYGESKSDSLYLNWMKELYLGEFPLEDSVFIPYPGRMKNMVN